MLGRIFLTMVETYSVFFSRRNFENKIYSIILYIQSILFMEIPTNVI